MVFALAFVFSHSGECSILVKAFIKINIEFKSIPQEHLL